MSTAEIVPCDHSVCRIGFACIWGVRQLQCKGYCFNNAYIYASKRKESRRIIHLIINSRAIVLLMLSALFLLNALRIVLRIGFLFYVSLVLIAAVILYSIVSSIIIEKNK